jgi:glycosyltransferase involved in cell wall biosynthesis
VKLQIGLNPEDKVLLVFGTIKQNKRLDWVIRAMGLIYDSYPQAKLVIVGKPQDRDVVSDMKLVEELGLSGRVYWRTERASDEELWQYFSSAEITLFPYEYIYQSGAIIMAFNFAKPVIATSVGSNIELIQDGKTGLLVAPDDPVGFANAITEILDDYKKAADLGQGGLRFVTDELSWEMIADRYLNYYRELVLVGSN